MSLRKKVFYGTPLSSVVSNNEPGLERAKKRYEEQLVKDDQGRRRFHGAFTGGFSAGYHNTVGSIEGFKPKHFVSSRNDKEKQKYSRSSFEHRPEDYMDEEDMGEFGIAPKRMKLRDHYLGESCNEKKNNLQSSRKLIQLFMKPSSVGHQILANMTNNKGFCFISCAQFPFLQQSASNPKYNYHGIGYMPLNQSNSSTSGAEASNPLLAEFKNGQKLSFVGEAFGSGVLDDDDDYLDSHLPWTHDVMDDHKHSIQKKYEKKVHKTSKSSYEDTNKLDGCLKGFDIARKICHIDELLLKSDLIVPQGWVAPVGNSYQDCQDIRRSHASTFVSKFTPSSQKTIETEKGPSGLMKYSDLKQIHDFTERSDEITEKIKEKAQISRSTTDWHPSSLLLKRFGIPKSNQTNKKSDETRFVEDIKDKANCDNVIAGEGLNSIFDINFHHELVNIDKSNEYPLNISDEDDLPVIGEFVTEHSNKQHVDLSDYENEDIAVLPTIKKQPELITISSSSEESDYGEDGDLYGPPLPPSMIALQELSSRSKNSNKYEGGSNNSDR